jgi:glycosyltransferase involved in cell wall biosynthesis
VRYTIGTVVSDWTQYDAMQKSFIRAGFSQRDCQYLPLNNVGENNFDLFSGGNTILSQASGDFVILVHQDVLCTPDNREKLDDCLTALEDFDSAWAVAGNAGERHGEWFVRITDPYGPNQSSAPVYPQGVNMLDGNFLVVKRNTNVAFSHNLSGFHYYGWDLCLNADIRGYFSYVIDFHITHNCKGTYDPQFPICKEAFIAKWKKAFRLRTIGAFDNDRVTIP